MTILAKIEGYGQAILSVFKPKPVAATKLLTEFLAFLAGFPYTQLMAAALAQGTDTPLDINLGKAIALDIAIAFFAEQSMQATTMSVANRMGIPPAVALQIVIAPAANSASTAAKT